MLSKTTTNSVSYSQTLDKCSKSYIKTFAFIEINEKCKYYPGNISCLNNL